MSLTLPKTFNNINQPANFAGNGRVQRVPTPSSAAEEETGSRQAGQVGQPMERDEEFCGEGHHQAALPRQLHGAALISAGRVVQNKALVLRSRKRLRK